MTNNAALIYLEKYRKNTELLIADYFKLKIKELKKIGKVSADLLTRFSKTAILGKKLRGALMTLGYEIANGKDMHAIFDASIFMELMHAGLLVHDDIMDNDDIRRGLTALHKQYNPVDFGRSMAINAGDMAFYLSWEKLMNSRFNADKLAKAGKIYSQYLIRVISGQISDVSAPYKKMISKDAIMNVLKYKTAEYTGVFPLEIGAVLGGMNDKKKLNSLKDYGLSLGWAFQIQDDILGLFGIEEKTGKPLASDIREGKRTLFIYYVLKFGNSSQKEFVTSLLGNENLTRSDIIKMQKLFKDLGAYDYVLKLGWEYVNKGIKVIPDITPNKKLQEILVSFITFMMERTR